MLGRVVYADVSGHNNHRNILSSGVFFSSRSAVVPSIPAIIISMKISLGCSREATSTASTVLCRHELVVCLFEMALQSMCTSGSSSTTRTLGGITQAFCWVRSYVAPACAASSLARGI